MKRVLLALFLIGLGVGAIGLGSDLIRDYRENPADYFTEPQTLALAEALMANDRDAIATLIAAGSDLDAPGRDGVTLLQWQLLRGDYARFRWLLDLGADPNVRGWHGTTAVHIAAMHKNDVFLKLILDRGADPNVTEERLTRTPLFSAMDAREQRNIDLLIERGADIEYADSTGTRPLLHAARTNSSENVVRFLELGADPNATDRIGVTFQPSFFRTNPEILGAIAIENRKWVVDHLRARGIPLDPNASRISE